MSNPQMDSDAMVGVADDCFLRMEGICKAFAGEEVLRGISLRVERGEIYTLLGGSGTGKSVTLKHIVGLLRPDSGRIWVEGQDATELSERDWVDVRKRVAYVFQGAALFDSLSVMENVAYGLREHTQLSQEKIRKRVSECLAAVGLTGIEERMPSELSGGMRKRVGVARAIALEPAAILYDEPTTGLDPANSRRIGELIVSLRERLSVTSIIVTHDLDLCFGISDRIGLLHDGRLVAQGSPDEIRTSTQPEVQQFLTGGTDLEADAVWLTDAAAERQERADREEEEKALGA